MLSRLILLLFFFNFTSISAAIPLVVSIVDTTTLKGNAKTLSDYLFCSNSPSTNTDFNTITDTLAGLEQAPLIDALMYLSPSSFGALTLVSAYNANDIFRTASAQMHESKKDDGRFYAIPLYSNFAQKRRDGQFGFDTNNAGIIVGGDYLGMNHLQAGALAGYTYTKLQWRSNAGRTKINSAYLAPYFGYTTENAGFIVSPMGIINQHDVHAHIIFPSVDRMATSKHYGGGIGGHIEGTIRWGYGPEDKRRFYLEPSVICDYICSWEEAFTEGGADSLDTQMPSQRTSYIAPKGIFEIKIPMSDGKDLTITSNIGVGYSGFFILSPYTTTASFRDQTACTPNFITKSYSSPYNQVLGLYSLEVKDMSGVSTTLSYEITAGNGAINQYAQARGQVIF